MDRGSHATSSSNLSISDETYDDTGALRSATLTWIKAGNRRMKDWDNTTLGTLRVNESPLVVEVNSARRRRRIEKEIAKYLKSTATLVDTTVTDITEVLKQRRSSASASVASLPPQDTAPSSPELQVIEAELARKHWDAWLDTKVPALGNKTPRHSSRRRTTCPLRRACDHPVARSGFVASVIGKEVGLD